MRVPSPLCVALSLLPAVAAAAGVPPAGKPLTLEDVVIEGRLAGPGIEEPAWRDGRRFTYLVTEGPGSGDGATLREYDTATGKAVRLLDPGTLSGAPKELSLRGYRWNRAGSALLLSVAGDLWLWEAASGRLRRLTHDGAGAEDGRFSPDGRHVAFIRENDLFLLDLETGVETRLTKTGSETLLNGRLDWVYEEELEGRGHDAAFAFSPDGTAIAYLSLDEASVPVFPIVDYNAGGKLVRQRYPRPGDPNPVPSVHVVTLDGTETALFRPGPEVGYVAPGLSFTGDSGGVSFLLLDRRQTRRTIVLLPRRGGPPRTLLTETDAAWINATRPPRFLKDGSFLLLSERSGFLHFYRFSPDGNLRNAVTSGPWMVDEIWDVDEAKGLVYFVATKESPVERHVYRARLDGTEVRRLTPERGTHGLKLSPDGSFFLDTFSDASTPPRTALYRTDGTRVALVDQPADHLADFALGRIEISSFEAPDGTLLFTRLVKPPAFDPARRYPVVVRVYGGPHGQVVKDAWERQTPLDLLFASKGFLVWSLDNRGSWGRGHAFETPLLMRTGEVELRDQLIGIEKLRGRPYVDGSRIGIWGWSYGGYLTLYAATHAGETFRCAAAGAPVTDWALYDSIYTERYMKLPGENQEGYRASAPAPDRLSTKLLILHGLLDDNVHLSNSLIFADGLMKARKDFVFVPLPRQKHGPHEPAARFCVDQRLLEWFEQNL